MLLITLLSKIINITAFFLETYNLTLGQMVMGGCFNNMHQHDTDGCTCKKTHMILPDERPKHGLFDTGQPMQFNKDEFSKVAEQLGRG